jgi:hypothetical protein
VAKSQADTRLGLSMLASTPVTGILGLRGWLAFIRPELLPLVSAYAAKTVCSNVFIAKRDADAVIRTDVQFAEHRVTKLVKIDIDTANRRVEAAIFGLFARRYAGYAEGRGCTIVSKDEIPGRAALAAAGGARRALADRRDGAIVR